MSRNDYALTALETLTGITGSYNDLILAFLQDNGATSGDVLDAWHEYLDGQSIAAGCINDRWYAWLTGLGYSGALPDMFYAMWAAGGPSQVDEFIFEITLAGADTFTLPLRSGYTYNFTVDWGDESQSEITAYNDPDITHSYSGAGTYTVTISGTCQAWYFNNGGDRLLVTSVVNLGVVGWTRLENAFYGCTNMTSFVAGNTDTSSVTNMGSMLRGLTSLTTLNVAGLNTASCLNMSAMFDSMSSITTPPDVSGFDTSACTNMFYMFNNMSSITTPPDVSGFVTSLVTDMSYMFSDLSSLTTPPDVSGFDTSACTGMSRMFNNMFSLTTPPDVSGFDTSLVTNMYHMFFNMSSVTTDVAISGWDVSLVTSGGNFLNAANGALSTAEYDAALIYWDSLASVSTCTWHFGDATYSAGAAATARASLVGKGWTITDGGPA